MVLSFQLPHRGLKSNNSVCVAIPFHAAEIPKRRPTLTYHLKMSAKDEDYKECKSESKSSSKQVEDEDNIDYSAGAKGSYQRNPPKIDITAIEVDSAPALISDPLHIKIRFELDRDCVAANWCVKFLVDSGEKRIIKILGDTRVEDYPDGDSEMEFLADTIDVTGIPPSTLANSGLLMACFVVDGDEVASVNMVVNVTNRNGAFFREILNPLE